jgi:peptidoglycan/xylan/chitin deacetylase (PgdA/CDA1 family)
MPRGGWMGPVLTDEQYLAKWKADCDILPNGCWHWKKWKVIGKFMYDREKGYAMAGYRGKATRLNRLIAGWNIGRPLVKGEVGCHTCDHPPCINPAHLWVGSVSDNTQDRLRKGRDHHSNITHCPHGHEYAGDNLWVDSKGFRHCRACARARMKTPKYRARQKELARLRRARIKAQSQIAPE